jgi:HSP20 family protein
MTTLTRWEPVRDMVSLRKAFDRFLEEPFFESMPYWLRRGDSYGMAVDVVEDDNAYIVKAAVPGAKPEDVEVTLNNNVLTIKGETKEDKEIKEENYHLRECRSGSFMRSLTLPSDVKADAIEASHKDGMLTIRLPKSETVKSKKIAVKTS